MRPPAPIPAGDALTWLAPLVLVGALLFNAMLAVVNANVSPLSRSHVMLAEIMLAGLALLLALRGWRPHMFPWFALIYISTVLFLFSILINQGINLKHIRDAIVFPIYVLLGMVWAGRPFVPVLVGIQVIIVGVLVVEALSPGLYAQLFDVTAYYINTRDFDPERFQYTPDGFFISAIRPGERFIPGFDWLHRTSSVFLEPVSLGNYVVIATILTLTFWKEMGVGIRTLMVITTGFILIGSDSRLGTVTCLVIVVGSPLFVRLPKYVHALYLPLVVAAAALAVAALGFQPGDDDFPGRLAWGVSILGQLEFGELIGYARHADQYVDAGLAYLIVTQSLFGAAASWLWMAFGFGETTARERIFIHGIMVYFALSLIISYSAFSIKTAALMWFVFGYLVASRCRAATGAHRAASQRRAFRPGGPAPSTGRP